jgi:hypothetical protein
VDTDADGLPDFWEDRFGLDLSSTSGMDGANGDPDGDGQTNAQELAVGTHPRGFYQRSLAEGALNTFFDTRFAIFNVSLETAHLQMRLYQSDGTTAEIVESLAPLRRRTIARASSRRCSARSTSRPSSNLTNP